MLSTLELQVQTARTSTEALNRIRGRAPQVIVAGHRPPQPRRGRLPRGVDRARPRRPPHRDGGVARRGGRARPPPRPRRHDHPLRRPAQRAQPADRAGRRGRQAAGAGRGAARPGQAAQRRAPAPGPARDPARRRRQGADQGARGELPQAQGGQPPGPVRPGRGDRGPRPVHQGSLRPGRRLLAGPGQGVGLPRRRPRDPRVRRVPPRHRQDRHPRLGPVQARAARSRRVGPHARAPGEGLRDRVEDRDAQADHERGPQPPRALGRHRLPRQAGLRRHPDGGAHRRDRRRLRRDGDRPARTRRRCRSTSARRCCAARRARCTTPS